MTNGDVIKDLFDPRDDQIKTYGDDWVEIEIQRQGINFSCTQEWWNAPYQKDEVILTNKEYRELVSSEYENGYAKGYREALEQDREALEQETVLDNIRAELIQSIQNGTLKIENGSEELFRIIDRAESKESATVAKFHDFYPEDRTTWPPADEEILVKNCVGDNFLAYLVFDDGVDGGWGFYSEDGDPIADLDEIDAWMQIPQHERDKNYIPKRRTEDLTIDAPEEEKDMG